MGAGGFGNRAREAFCAQKAGGAKGVFVFRNNSLIET